MRRPMRRARKGLELGSHRLFRENVERQRGGREHECVERETRGHQTRAGRVGGCPTIHAATPSSRENRRASAGQARAMIVTISARIIAAAIASCGFCASSHKLYE